MPNHSPHSQDLPETFRCLLVTRDAAGQVSAAPAMLPLGRLPPGDVLIRVAWSSLNYKDALAATAHPGVVKTLPHIPGIDAAGVVVESASPKFRPGDEVVVTGYELGSPAWGGWSEYCRAPADWVVARPAGLSLRECMILGTAGFTAAQSVDALQRLDVTPDSGEIVVTGATGGVGAISVAILAKLGYRVAAVTGKSEAEPHLRAWGAARVLSRAELDDATSRPLLSAKFAGGVDTVGGNMLATLLRSVQPRGCVAACGLVAGAELKLTVYPFILRGVSLVGIASADCPMPKRLEIWRRLSGEWKPDCLERIAREVTLDDLPKEVRDILAGRVTGRVVARLGR